MASYKLVPSALAVPTALVALITLIVPAASARPAAIIVQPSEIEIGMLFGGATIRIEGEVPESEAAAIIVAGEETSLHLKRKGKVWGLLWLNVGEATFTSVPSLYLLQTSAGLETLAECGTQLGYPALEAGTDLHPDPQLKHDIFADLILLKESEGMYRVSENSVTVMPDERGGLLAAAEFHLPSRIPPGQYDIRLVGLADGHCAVHGWATLSVRKVKMVRFISQLAETQGLLYGIIAVVIAVAAGLITGLLFGRGGKHGH